MSSIVKLSYEDFVAILSIDEATVGNYLGISDRAKLVWTFAIYLGGQRIAKLYESENGVIVSSFEQMLSKKNLNQTSLSNLAFDHIIDNATLLDKNEHLEFFIYSLNLFDVCKQLKIQTAQFLKTNRSNLEKLHPLDDGDIVSFDRGVYTHHGLLTDKSRMIITHRSGDPEDLVSNNSVLVNLASVSGVQLTEKALVTEDHLIEIAGWRSISKSNEIYDAIKLPRSKEEILKEAKRRLGEKGYSLTSRNCHHFVSECRNGLSYSPEVQTAINFATKAIAVGAVTLTSLVGYALSKRTNILQERAIAASPRTTNTGQNISDTIEPMHERASPDTRIESTKPELSPTGTKDK